jgi:hypothetical protein
VQALKNLWHKWEKIAARVDNPVGRTVLTALLVALLYQFHAYWWSKLFIVLYMLTLGKFVFNVLSRVILTIIYVLLIMPVGFFVRMGDPLHIRQKTGNTFWIPRGTPDESLEGAKRQG